MVFSGDFIAPFESDPPLCRDFPGTVFPRFLFTALVGSSSRFIPSPPPGIVPLKYRSKSQEP